MTLNNVTPLYPQTQFTGPHSHSNDNERKKQRTPLRSRNLGKVISQFLHFPYHGKMKGWIRRENLYKSFQFLTPFNSTNICRVDTMLQPLCYTAPSCIIFVLFHRKLESGNFHAIFSTKSLDWEPQDLGSAYSNIIKYLCALYSYIRHLGFSFIICKRRRKHEGYVDSSQAV